MQRGSAKKKKRKEKQNVPRGSVNKKNRSIGQYVGDFCSVPRGGVKGKWKNRSRTDRALSRESSPCATRWREGKEKFGREPFAQQVWDFILFSLSREVA